MIDKSKKYLIALDVDSTLRTDAGIITANTKDVINKLQDAGHVVVICSGRPKHSALRVAEEINATKYLISFNGARVDDLSKSYEIFSSKLEKQKLLDLLNICYERDIKFVLNLNGNDYTTKIIDDNNSQTLLSHERFNKLVNEHEFPQGLIIDYDAEKVNNLRKKIIDSHEFSMGNHSCFSKKNKYYWFCINNVNSSKGKALLALADYLNISYEQTIAIGNDENDISMFEASGISVVVDNASDEVKKYAKYITDSNNEEGVANFLKKLL